MKTLLLSAAIVTAAICGSAPAGATTVATTPYAPKTKTTIAVMGDWPYNQLLIDNANLLINSVNADPDVSLLVHVGDIHSGSMACTSANVLPPISSSDPGFNQKVFSFFQRFRTPVVYTPGDNEWTDCHKSKEFKSGAPLSEIAAVRSLFFAKPGHTLGLNEMLVNTQAEKFDPAYPSDAQFVENVIWWDAQTLFVTVDMPGSNNDTLAWTNGFENDAAHQKEVIDRNFAAERWLNAAFQIAIRENMKAIVIALQADMWDPAAVAPGGDGLNGYSTFVAELARLCLIYNKPVLLLNGDSHLYGADKPLADPNSPTGLIHHTTAVPNLTRITVQGSTSAPAEWLKLTIDASAASPFSWINVPYCKDPLTSCK
ncbi:metallophosphoesterase [Methylocystis parvus]|uniref:Calcineurin-like phosphoesterase domain-containing protein n=1 Tax=Methylocystis parvus TaxID=134 RepID=A0A6B8M6Q5_9HYPH|nr:metallophosphoesterase [Methylocystis parvus]QGM98168.1 hypothetical protein F7D14_12250 [Methylocystis parvus]WBK01508.1 metallophosphoesterase [Methylocystis parvus OBBP]